MVPHAVKTAKTVIVISITEFFIAFSSDSFERKDRELFQKVKLNSGPCHPALRWQFISWMKVP